MICFNDLLSECIKILMMHEVKMIPVGKYHYALLRLVIETIPPFSRARSQIIISNENIKHFRL